MEETTNVTTACGGEINLPEEQIGHLAAHPEAAEHLAEAALKVTLPESGFLLTTVDMGRVIGRTACVPAPKVAPDETCLFSFRVGRDVPSRVLVGVEKPETTKFSIIAGRDKEGVWNLITAFAGAVAPREPHDPNLIGNEPELIYWCEHALVHDDGWGEPFESTWQAELKKLGITQE